ncbi:hypothetical protein GOV10_01590, partial [Candidatus Woesearchaeota archaeon]|nr:hypothetical protein [Candidatus Woesearchaeota archaeon]
MKQVLLLLLLMASVFACMPRPFDELILSKYGDALEGKEVLPDNKITLFATKVYDMQEILNKSRIKNADLRFCCEGSQLTNCEGHEFDSEHFQCTEQKIEVVKTTRMRYYVSCLGEGPCVVGLQKMGFWEAFFDWID